MAGESPHPYSKNRPEVVAKLRELLDNRKPPPSMANPKTPHPYSTVRPQVMAKLHGLLDTKYVLDELKLHGPEAAWKRYLELHGEKKRMPSSPSCPGGAESRVNHQTP